MANSSMPPLTMQDYLQTLPDLSGQQHQTPQQQSTVPSSVVLTKDLSTASTNYSAPYQMKGGRTIQNPMTPPSSLTKEVNEEQARYQRQQQHRISGPNPALNKAMANPDPLSPKLTTWAEQGAAAYAKLDRIRSNPDFQNQPESTKRGVLEAFYNTYINPIYAKSGRPVPNPEQWMKLAQNSKPGQMVGGIQNATESPNFQALQKMGQSFDVADTRLTMFGLKVEHSLVSNFYGLRDYMNHTHDGAILAARHLQQNMQGQKVVGERLQQQTELLNSIPPQTALQGAASWVGEQLAQAPLYVALAEGGEAIAGAAGVEGSVVGGLRAAPSLTAKLVATEGGKAVARSFLRYGEGYFAGYATSGGDKQQAKEMGKSFAEIGGAIGEGVPAVKGAYQFGAALRAESDAGTKVFSNAFIKNTLARFMSLGGPLLNEELMQSTTAEAGAAKEMKRIANLPKSDSPAAHTLLGDIRIHPATDAGGKVAEGAGHFEFRGEIHPYSSIEERDNIFKTLQSRLTEERATNDPVSANLHAVVSDIRGQIAGQMFPDHTLSDLTPGQTAAVNAEFLSHNDEAAEEITLHNQEQYVEERKANIAAQAAKSPQLTAAMALVKQNLGIDVVLATTEAETKAVAKKTGVISIDSLLERLSNSQPEEVNAAVAKELGISPEELEYQNTREGYASHNASVRDIVSFRNPASRVKWQAAVSDFQKDSFNAGYGKLKQMTGDHIKFEKPEHRLIYMWGFRDSMQAQDKRLLRMMVNKVRWNSAGKELPLETLNAMSGWMRTHMLQLVDGKQLINGEPIFASTIMRNMGPVTPTQQKLLLEIAADRLRPFKESLEQRHPDAWKGILGFVTGMERVKIKCPTPEAWLKADEQLRKILVDPATMETLKSPEAAAFLKRAKSLASPSRAKDLQKLLLKQAKKGTK